MGMKSNASMSNLTNVTGRLLSILFFKGHLSQRRVMKTEKILISGPISNSNLELILIF